MQQKCKEEALPFPDRHAKTRHGLIVMQRQSIDLSHYMHANIPYRTKIRRTKVSKFQLGVENFVRRNILSVENFVQYFNTKVR